MRRQITEVEEAIARNAQKCLEASDRKLTAHLREVVCGPVQNMTNGDPMSSIKEKLAVVEAVHADAETKGFRRGNGGSSTVPCPLCKTGTIHYRVASVNGHIHAGCTTDDCIRFME